MADLIFALIVWGLTFLNVLAVWRIADLKE